MDKNRGCSDSPTGLLTGLAFLFLTFGGSPAHAQGEPALEYRVKAAYLYNFIKFVDWPKLSETSGAALPIRVCLMGEDNFQGALDHMVRQKAKNRSIELTRVSAGDDLVSCHLLYISGDALPVTDGLVQQSLRNQILLVSDSQDFARRGGTIGIVVKPDRVDVEINHEMAKRAGLKLSANLLEIASTVYGR
jgi:hypothetical protein